MPKKGKKKHQGEESSDFFARASKQFRREITNTIKKGQRWINMQKYDPLAASKIPDIMLVKGLQLRNGMTNVQKCAIEEEIRRADPSIRPVDTMAGVLRFMDHKKKKENQQINLKYPTESQEDLGYSAVFQDQQPEQTVVQEKLTEKQREAIQKDTIKSENINTVYDIGAVDQGRPPINDIYNRNPFETDNTGYRNDAQGNPLAYMKIDAPVGKISDKTVNFADKLNLP
ncbi:MAG: hypothetical protein EZS28_031181 [Streblomastix strix]|uniref:Uncharacterized protein n=1 Tax=Streblomastix strix TaxID=222440 RepID=A0A5J4UT74_9EUKA|nr:MAG: hypothetical protein EZS28_031181 [Streblomastix strix]